MPSITPTITQLEETLTGFDQGLGMNALIGFIDWILMSRGLSAGSVFNTETEQGQVNQTFISDLQRVFTNEPITSLAVVIGSSFMTGKESFVLECEPNQKVPDSGRQLLGARLVQSLSALELPTFANGIGIHILIRVLRNPGLRTMVDGFSVVDEDIEIFNERQSVLRWKTNFIGAQSQNQEMYCWMLWTKDRIRV